MSQAINKVHRKGEGLPGNMFGSILAIHDKVLQRTQEIKSFNDYTTCSSQAIHIFQLKTLSKSLVDLSCVT